jgi:hypothetical protein
MWLQTSSGTWAQVFAVQTWNQAATVHNLTVQGDHTYPALAGDTPVLVHNCNLKPGEHYVYRVVQERELQ